MSSIKHSLSSTPQSQPAGSAAAPLTRRGFLAAGLATASLPLLPGSPLKAAGAAVKTKKTLQQNEWLPSPDGWREKYFPEAGVPQEKGVKFERLQDPQYGAVLAVGPFEAGQFSARWEHSDRLPWHMATVTGFYRTEGITGHEAAVILQLYKGSQRIVQRGEALEPAAQWTPFEIALRWPPPAVDSLAVALGLTAHTRGRVLFAGIRARAAASPLDFPANPGPATRAKPPRGLAPAKYYRIERAGDAWWLVAPDGTAGLSLGADGMARKGSMTGIQAVATARGLGFNSMGGWSSPDTWAKANAELRRTGQPEIPAFLTLQAVGLGGGFDVLVTAAGEGPKEEHAMPDPFDPRYEAAVRAKVRKRLAEGARENWFVGWFADNEVDLRDLHRKVWSGHCALALLESLKKKYGSIQSLNAKWGAHYASFDALRTAKPDPTTRAGAMFEDFYAFRREIIRQWVTVSLRAIREEDPGRLVFSNRFHRSVEAELPDLIDLFSPYDAIAGNLYPQNRNVGLSEAERRYLRLLHEKTGKPVLVTEWSVPALDSGLYEGTKGLDWSLEAAVGTQTERARQAACALTEMLNMPFVIGAHWFIWQDYDNAKRRANRGLVKANGEPWTELQQALQAVNLKFADRS